MPFDPRTHRYRAAAPPAHPPKKPPPAPIDPKHCRYHPGIRACSVVFARTDWVFLCRACGNAVRLGGLRVVDHDGTYEGFLPALG